VVEGRRGVAEAGGAARLLLSARARHHWPAATTTTTHAPRDARCRRLVLEWGAYVSRTSALRRVFVSVKGFYYQAAVGGADITWLVPHQLAQVRGARAGGGGALAAALLVVRQRARRNSRWWPAAARLRTCTHTRVHSDAPSPPPPPHTHTHTTACRCCRPTLTSQSWARSWSTTPAWRSLCSSSCTTTSGSGARAGWAAVHVC
jgi:hypothetical protein